MMFLTSGPVYRFWKENYFWDKYISKLKECARNDFKILRDYATLIKIRCVQCALQKKFEVVALEITVDYCIVLVIHPGSFLFDVFI